MAQPRRLFQRAQGLELKSVWRERGGAPPARGGEVRSCLGLGLGAQGPELSLSAQCTSIVVTAAAGVRRAWPKRCLSLVSDTARRPFCWLGTEAAAQSGRGSVRSTWPMQRRPEFVLIGRRLGRGRPKRVHRGSNRSVHRGSNRPVISVGRSSHAHRKFLRCERLE